MESAELYDRHLLLVAQTYVNDVTHLGVVTLNLTDQQVKNAIDGKTKKVDQLYEVLLRWKQKAGKDVELTTKDLYDVLKADDGISNKDMREALKLHSSYTTTDIQKLQSTLKRYYETQVRNIAIARNRPARHLDEYFIEPELKKLYNDTNKSESNMEDILKLKLKRTLLLSEAGMGKTILTKKYGFDWSQEKEYFEGTDLILVLPLSFVSAKHKTFLEAVIDKTSEGENINAKHLDKYITDNQEKVTLIMDGLDELPRNKEFGEFLKDIENIIFGKKYGGVRLLVTSRHSAMPSLSKDWINKFNDIFEVCCFTKESARKYVKKFFKETPEIVNKIIVTIEEKGFSPIIKSCPFFLNSFCIANLNKYHKHPNHQNFEPLIPDSVTYMMKHILDYYTWHFEWKQTECGLSDQQKRKTTLSADEIINKVGNFALRGIMEQKNTWSQQYLIDMCGKDTFLKACEIGIIHSYSHNGSMHTMADIMKETMKRNENYVRFPHKLIQEFAAAQFLSQNTIEDLVGLLSQFTTYFKDYKYCGLLENVLPFVCALNEYHLGFILLAVSYWRKKDIGVGYYKKPLKDVLTDYINFDDDDDDHHHDNYDEDDDGYDGDHGHRNRSWMAVWAIRCFHEYLCYTKNESKPARFIPALPRVMFVVLVSDLEYRATISFVKFLADNNIKALLRLGAMCVNGSEKYIREILKHGKQILHILEIEGSGLSVFCRPCDKTLSITELNINRCDLREVGGVSPLGLFEEILAFALESHLRKVRFEDCDKVPHGFYIEGSSLFHSFKSSNLKVIRSENEKCYILDHSSLKWELQPKNQGKSKDEGKDQTHEDEDVDNNQDDQNENEIQEQDRKKDLDKDLDKDQDQDVPLDDGERYIMDYFVTYWEPKPQNQDKNEDQDKDNNQDQDGDGDDEDKDMNDDQDQEQVQDQNETQEQSQEQYPLEETNLDKGTQERKTKRKLSNQETVQTKKKKVPTATLR